VGGFGNDFFSSSLEMVRSKGDIEMIALLQNWLKRSGSFVIVAIIATSCATNPTSQPESSQPQARFIAVQAPVSVLSGGETQTELEKDNSIDLGIKDRVSSNDGGRGLLSFEDNLEVELFHNSELEFVDGSLETGGSSFVELSLPIGQTLVRLSLGKINQVILGTELETIRTLDPDTEFVVCHAPGKVTCQVVNKGVIEVSAQGKKEIIRAGEATYVHPGQPPSPPICVQEGEYGKWFADLQASREDQPLGALVASWPQSSCATLAQSPSTPTNNASLLPERMVKIDAGTYQIGGQKADEFHIAPQNVSLNSYWIDQYEVTNAEYQKFVQESGYPSPEGGFGEPNYPVQGISWEAAAAHCSWALKRLPTEAEWEVAARGTGNPPALFPWGDDPLNGGKVSELPRTETYEVGTYEFNQSPFGVFDMAGNVWEWVDLPYQAIPEGFRVLRGGRHGLIKDMAYRQLAEPNDERFIPHTGFRCAADQVGGE
jgi:formylglycine-generating enzyme required for sulfatase activity